MLPSNCNINVKTRRFAASLAIVVPLAMSPLVAAQEAPQVSAWRVECAGDGKILDCRALQQVVNREDKQFLAQAVVRVPSDSKTAVMMIQLSLGINVAEQVQIKVDNGAAERQPIQTCTANGCFVGMPLNDKLLASMRSGTQLKITLQDSSKRSTTIDMPLLGFGLAIDKAR